MLCSKMQACRPGGPAPAALGRPGTGDDKGEVGDGPSSASSAPSLMTSPRRSQRIAEDEGTERSSNGAAAVRVSPAARSEEHTSELQSLMRNSYTVFRFKKKN